MRRFVEEPLFRCIAPLASIGGLSFKRGDTWSSWRSDWPDPAKWVPENESARRLASYYAKYGGPAGRAASRVFPQYPAAFDGTHRRYFLPANLPLGRFYRDGQIVEVSAPEDDVAGEHVPKYIAPGRSEFVHLQWPSSKWKAANSAAAD